MKLDPPDAEPRRDPDPIGSLEPLQDAHVSRRAGGPIRALVEQWRHEAQRQFNENEFLGIPGLSFTQCANDLDAALAVASPSEPRDAFADRPVHTSYLVTRLDGLTAERDTLKAELDALRGSAPSIESTRFAWLMERSVNGHPAYWDGGHAESFTYDANKAVQWCRKEDLLACTKFMRHYQQWGWTPVEHGFMTAPSPSAPASPSPA